MCSFSPRSWKIWHICRRSFLLSFQEWKSWKDCQPSLERFVFFQSTSQGKVLCVICGENECLFEMLVSLVFSNGMTFFRLRCFLFLPLKVQYFYSISLSLSYFSQKKKRPEGSSFQFLSCSSLAYTLNLIITNECKINYERREKKKLTKSKL
jgi:hypothetical protein